MKKYKVVLTWGSMHAPSYGKSFDFDTLEEAQDAIFGLRAEYNPDWSKIVEVEVLKVDDEDEAE